MYTQMRTRKEKHNLTSWVDRLQETSSRTLISLVFVNIVRNEAQEDDK